MQILEKTNQPQTQNGPALIDVGEVATLLGCSKRHVMRLSDEGRMPRSVKLGWLVKWNRAEIERWIANGCKPVRQKRRTHQ